MHAGSIPTGGAFFGEGSGPIYLDEVACEGTEERLVDCPANPLYDHDCNHDEDAAVRCGLEGSYFIVI